MGIRNVLQTKPIGGIAVAACLLLISGLILAKQYWPQKKANLSQTYYTDDDGASWFADSAYLVPPFDHNGKTAVLAAVYSYDNGSKKFCAYEQEYTPKAKKQLEAALADAQKNGQPPASVALYHDRTFMMNGTQVKSPGSTKWVSIAGPDASSVCAVHSPDDTAVDQCFVY